MTERSNAVVLQANVFPWTHHRPAAQAQMRGLNSIDGSFLPFIVEELLAFSVREIIIPEVSAPGMFVQHLPDTLAPFVRVVDTRSAFDITTAYLEPVLKEFGLRVDPSGITSSLSLDNPLNYRLYELLRDFELFVTGMQHNAAIDFGYEELKTAAASVRAAARDPETRRTLAELEGVLNTYESVSVPALVARSTVATDHAERFRKTLHDSDYADLSIAAYNVGVPARMRRAVLVMKEKLLQILAKESHRQLFDLGGRALTVATKVPSLSSSLVQAVLGPSKYLPPELSFRPLIGNARENWLRADPPCIPVPNLRALMGKPD